MLVIYNWEYQIERHFELEKNTKIIKINAFEPVTCISNAEVFPIVEALSFLKMLVANFFYSMKLRRIVKQHKQIIIFGLQDHLSQRAAELAIKAKKNVFVVPDNIEFFLRPGRYCQDQKIGLRKMLRLLGLGYRLTDINKKVGIFSNRYLYKIPRGCELSEKYSFFDLNTISRYRNDNSTMFISQPYYLDYNLDVDKFISKLDIELSKLSFNFHDSIYMNFHQRDSDEYKRKIVALNYQSSNESEIFENILGFFSTLLFVKAIQGHRVFSIFFAIKDFFPKEYAYFVSSIADELGICLKGKSHWSIDSSDLAKLSLEIING
jgi:hypothetical protein